jgi:F-type H+-transporting ATPase subunit delta
VASKTRSSGTAALRYATALIDLAEQAGAIPHIEQDVLDCRAMIAGSKDLQTFIQSPLVSTASQKAVIEEFVRAAKFSPLMKNFLLTLAHNRRFKDVDSILQAVQAKISVAQDLTPAQAKSLQESLTKSVGRSVTLSVSLDKALIGGMIVTMGSIMIDDSVKSKLDRMSRAMKQTGKAA